MSNSEPQKTSNEPEKSQTEDVTAQQSAPKSSETAAEENAIVSHGPKPATEAASKLEVASVQGALVPGEDAKSTPVATPPWTLQQFFNGEIDLDAELSKRFPTLPVMSDIRFRTLGQRTGRNVATLSTQDQSASLIIDADTPSKVIQLSFSFASMLSLRFTMDNLSDMDRERWLELMHRQQGGLAFLWGQERWERDYLICISRRYYTNIYAFSPRYYEAAARLTPGVTRKLLKWLRELWKEKPQDKQEPPQMLSW
ncbi:MAG: hypothetical protein D6712_11200 [Chloroflexi bacterium]|nr:MAG: hypothetical protein D6712_11200 [Chloroflexota bacterium]